MKSFSVLPEILETLYINGEISDAALAAIAPITWLAKHYPELLKHPEKALSAIIQKPRTCESCIHFSSVHECCMTRIDGKSTYLPVSSQTHACQDFERVELPSVVQREQQ